jgi:hypothetical protein
MAEMISAQEMIECVWRAVLVHNRMCLNMGWDVNQPRERCLTIASIRDKFDVIGETTEGLLNATNTPDQLQCVADAFVQMRPSMVMIYPAMYSESDANAFDDVRFAVHSVGTAEIHQVRMHTLRLDDGDVIQAGMYYHMRDCDHVRQASRCGC